MIVELSEILEGRGKEYGDFRYQFSMATKLRQVVEMHDDENLSEVNKEALGMICTKISRIVCGNENNIDSWRDIAGYATLIADHLEAME